MFKKVIIIFVTFLPVIFMTTEAKPAAVIDSNGKLVDTFIENSQPKKVAPGVALDIFSKIREIRKERVCLKWYKHSITKQWKCAKVSTHKKVTGKNYNQPR
jgi:hypothetical protein